MNGKGNDDPLTRLEQRLEQARKLEQERRPQRRDTSTGLGSGYRIAIELVLAVLIGTAIGWFLDNWLGTSPFLLILFFFLGTAAGVMNVARTAKALGQDLDRACDEVESGDKNGGT